MPELFGRSGAVAVAALLLLPFAALAARRRWAAFAVGGALAIFAITLIPWIFTPFSDAVSLSQSRRLAGFLPFGIALAGGIGVLARLLGPLVAPLALALGVALQLLYPGDFGYFLEDGGPAWATWFAVIGCVVALVVGFWGRPPLERRAALASCLLLLPTYVHGLANWSPSPSRPPNILSDGLLAAVRERVPTGAVVYADPQASYRLGAYAPVRVCVNPISHVADTVDNRPRERAREFLRSARAGDIVTPARRCGATWLVVDRERLATSPRRSPSTATPAGRSSGSEPRERRLRDSDKSGYLQSMEPERCTSRLNVTLDHAHAEKLRRMAEQAYTQEGTLARSLLSRAIDEADIDAESMVELLNGIPGALERATLGRRQGRTGQTIPLDDL